MLTPDAGKDIGEWAAIHTHLGRNQEDSPPPSATLRELAIHVCTYLGMQNRLFRAAMSECHERHRWQQAAGDLPRPFAARVISRDLPHVTSVCPPHTVGRQHAGTCTMA
jgi:hypothetical protein